MYTLPYDIGISGNLRYQSGQPFSRQIATRLPQGAATVNAEPRGSQRYSKITTLDLPISKAFQIKGLRLDMMLDAYNVTNENTAVNQVELSGPRYQYPLQILGPRVFRFGVIVGFLSSRTCPRGRCSLPMPQNPQGAMRRLASARGGVLSRLLVTWLAFATVNCVTSTPASPPAALLTIETLLEIKHPSRGTWSPDGRRVAYVWDRAGVQNVWVAGTSEGHPAALTHYKTGLVDGLFWSPDSQTVYFERAGDLWQVGGSDDAPRAVWETAEVESGVTRSPDGTRVAFVRDGDLWMRSLTGEDSGIRLTNTPESESGPVWSPDGKLLAFTITSSVRREEIPDFVGSKISFRWLERAPSQVAVVPATGGAVARVALGPGTLSAPRWIDSARLSLQRVSPDLTTREILVADAGGGESRVLHRDVDDKWWSLTYLGPEPVPSPDGRWIAFLSDRDGWDHVYVVPAAGGTAVQVTRGGYEASRLAWSPDSRRIAFDQNQGDNPGRRQLAVAEIGSQPEKAQILSLTSGTGTNTEPFWAPDGRRLLYQHTDPRNSADLYIVSAEPSAPQRRLTESMPAGIDRSALIEPRFVRYPATDGKLVPAYLFVPKGLDLSRRHPAIVWIHGDGITQNYDGWHVRRDYAVYYSFHQYLSQKGYVVLAIDYRGSIGYGKEWRQGHFRDLGGRDYGDIAAGMTYLKTLHYVDTEHVGVWGLSYGGFLTLQALTVTPELFRCGIDVAGVVDWRDWYKDPDGPWVKGRMGSPSEDPELYRRTAPVERVDRIVRPLLVLHGTADFNVPFLESVRLVDAATKAGKDIEFMMYPGELHYFHRGHVLSDAWRRVERFFDSHLRSNLPRPAGQP